MTQESGKPVAKKGIRVTWRGAVIIVIGLLLLVFGVQNRESASVHFLGFQFTVPIWLLVIAVLLMGMLVGGMVLTGVRKRHKPKPVRP